MAHNYRYVNIISYVFAFDAFMLLEPSVKRPSYVQIISNYAQMTHRLDAVDDRHGYKENGKC